MTGSFRPEAAGQSINNLGNYTPEQLRAIVEKLEAYE
jgi:hypothetical protein